MSDNQSNNKRIAKNTIFMYIRMAAIMLVQLYTSRVMLEALGVSDYGIYNVVAAFIVSFSFINGPLTAATQRFMTFELGEGQKGEVNKIFNLSIYIYAALTFILVVALEIGGQWFINNKMTLPQERIDAAHFLLQVSIASLVVNMMRTPYNSLLIAYEKMSIYAYTGILEAVLLLGNAFLLLYSPIDKLKLYSINLFTITVIITIILLVYTRFKLKGIKHGWYFDWAKCREILGFTGWSLFGSFAAMSANQGLNLLLNVFCGVFVNAAMGIANQVNAAINNFVVNFQVAFRPQIVKLYAGNDIENLTKLIHNSSKYSFLMLFAIVCPLSFNIQYVLDIWLKTPPELAAPFVVCMFAYALIESLSAPFWMTIQATGKIRNYQIAISSVMLMNVVFSYVFLKLGFPPVTVLITKCCLDVGYFVVRLYYVKKMIDFSIPFYLRSVVFPIILVSSTCLAILYFLQMGSLKGFVYLIISTLTFIAVYVPIVYGFVLKESEKIILKKYISKILHK